MRTGKDKISKEVKEKYEKKKGGFLANLFGSVLRNDKQGKKNFALPNRRQRRAERTHDEILSERKYKRELAPTIGIIKR